MGSKADIHAKLAEVVEAVEDVEGVRVEDAHIDTAVDPDTVNPIAAMMGGDPGEKMDIFHIIAEPSDEPEQEIPDEPDNDDEVDGVEIGIEHPTTQTEQ